MDLNLAPVVYGGRGGALLFCLHVFVSLLPASVERVSAPSQHSRVRYSPAEKD